MIFCYLRAYFSILKGVPYRLSLVLSEGCNLKCLHCHTWTQKYRELEFELIEKNLNSFPGNLCWLTITGGEPTIHSRFLDILRLINGYPKRLVVNVTTNGYVPIEQDVQDYLSHEFRHALYVNISLDGVGNAHNKSRGAKDAFERTTTTIRQLNLIAAKNNKIKIGVNLTISDHLSFEFEKTYRFICDRITKNINVMFIKKSKFYSNEKMRAPKLTSENRDQIMRFHISNIRNLAPDSVMRYLVGSDRIRPKKCGSVRSQILVGVDGERKICTVNYSSYYLPGQTIIRQRDDEVRLDSEITKSGCLQSCDSPCEKTNHVLLLIRSPKFFIIGSQAVLSIVWNYLQWKLSNARRLLTEKPTQIWRDLSSK